MINETTNLMNNQNYIFWEIEKENIIYKFYFLKLNERIIIIIYLIFIVLVFNIWTYFIVELPIIAYFFYISFIIFILDIYNFYKSNISEKVNKLIYCKNSYSSFFNFLWFWISIVLIITNFRDFIHLSPIWLIIIMSSPFILLYTYKYIWLKYDTNYAPKFIQIIIFSIATTINIFVSFVLFYMMWWNYNNTKKEIIKISSKRYNILDKINIYWKENINNNYVLKK